MEDRSFVIVVITSTFIVLAIILTAGIAWSEPDVVIVKRKACMKDCDCPDGMVCTGGLCVNDVGQVDQKIVTNVVPSVDNVMNYVGTELMNINRDTEEYITHSDSRHSQFSDVMDDRFDDTHNISQCNNEKECFAICPDTCTYHEDSFYSGHGSSIRWDENIPNFKYLVDTFYFNKVLVLVYSNGDLAAGISGKVIGNIGVKADLVVALGNRIVILYNGRLYTRELEGDSPITEFIQGSDYRHISYTLDNNFLWVQTATTGILYDKELNVMESTIVSLNSVRKYMEDDSNYGIINIFSNTLTIYPSVSKTYGVKDFCTVINSTVYTLESGSVAKRIVPYLNNTYELIEY